MPRVSELCADFADRFCFEHSRVAGVAKALREAGLVKAGPRGVNALQATSLDAARILIALMLRVKHHEAAEAVSLFGRFKPADGIAQIANKSAETFEDAFALVLDWCGKPYDGVDDPYYDGQNFDIQIFRDVSIGKLTVERLAVTDQEEADANADGVLKHVSFRFLHPIYHDLAADKPVLSGAAETAWRHYRSGFHEVPTLCRSDLIAIGNILAGHQPLGWEIGLK